MYDDDDIYSGDDSDVFESSAPQPDVTIGGKNVPGYLRDALTRYIQENPQISESYTEYKDDSDLTTFVRLYSIFTRPLAPVYLPEPTGALGIAIFGYLNDTTEGTIQRIYRVYELELNLIRLHGNASFIDAVYQAIVDSNTELCAPSQMFMQYALSLHEATWHCLRHTSDQYRDACELAGITPDEKVIEFGIKENADFAFALGERTTQVLAHYKYGDISQIAKMQEESTRRLFIKFFLPLVTRSREEIVKLLQENVAF